MRRPATLDRRSVLLGAAALTGVGMTGCSSGGRKLGEPPSAAKSSASRPTPARSAPSVDPTLRARAIAQERSLLAACAAPAGQQPFASIRSLHLAHLQKLGATAAEPPAAAHSPVAAALATSERTAAASLRTDCLQASPELAPVLASMAASAEVAAILLAP